MQDKLTPRQSRAWGLCALSVPAAMVLAGRSWLWVLAGSAAASGIVLFLQTLQRRSGQSLLEQMAQAFGQHGGQIVGAAVCLWLLLAASGAAAASQIAFEDDLGPLAPAVPLLLAALASRKGQAAAARVSGVLPAVGERRGCGAEPLPVPDARVPAVSGRGRADAAAGLERVGRRGAAGRGGTAVQRVSVPGVDGPAAAAALYAHEKSVGPVRHAAL